MFHQLLTPVGDGLLPSFLVAALPIATVLVLMGIVRRAAWEASLAGLVVGLVLVCVVGAAVLARHRRACRGTRGESGARGLASARLRVFTPRSCDRADFGLWHQRGEDVWRS